MNAAADRGMSVEECVYWMAVAGYGACVGDMIRRDAERLRTSQRYYVGPALRLIAKDSHEHRRHLVLWALQREAIRAIERERSGR